MDILVSVRDLPSLDLEDFMDRPDLIERFVKDGLVSLGTAPRSAAVWDCESGVGAICMFEDIGVEVLRFRSPWPNLKSSSLTISLLSRYSSSSIDDASVVGGVYGLFGV